MEYCDKLIFLFIILYSLNLCFAGAEYGEMVMNIPDGTIHLQGGDETKVRLHIIGGDNEDTPTAQTANTVLIEQKKSGDAIFTIKDDGETIINSLDTTILTLKHNGNDAFRITNTAVNIDATTDSTTTATGALQVDGGVGIAKDVVIGNDLLLKSDASVIKFGADSEVTLTHEADTGLQLNTILDITDTTDSTTTATGALQVDGGVGIAKDVVIGNDLLLKSDASVIKFGADSEVTLTHVADTGLSLNGDLVIANSGSIGSASHTNAITISSEGEVHLKYLAFDIETHATTGTSDVVRTMSETISFNDDDSTDDNGVYMRFPAASGKTGRMMCAVQKYQGNFRLRTNGGGIYRPGSSTNYHNHDQNFHYVCAISDGSNWFIMSEKTA